MTRVFISYGGPDVIVARQIEGALRSHGFDLAFFEKTATPGQRLHQFMRDGIESADAVVLVCSAGSLGRLGVLNEIEQCLRKEAKLGGRTFLFPVALDDFVFTDWRPAYAGYADEVRDRVVMTLPPCKPTSKIFKSSIIRLVDAISSGNGHSGLEEVEGIYNVEILDVAGHRAILTYTRRIVARRSGITQIDLQHFTASGQIEYLSSNIGELTSVRDEGGQRRATFTLHAPLQPNVVSEFTATFLALDCYESSTETASFTALRPYPSLSISVNLPSGRPARSARLIRSLGAVRSVVPCGDIVSGGIHLNARICSPTLYSTHILEWDW